MSNGKTIYIKSEKIDFIIEIENTILKSMNNKKSNYTINLNTQQIINNVKNNKGIISNGNKNTNKMKGNKYD